MFVAAVASALVACSSSAADTPVNAFAFKLYDAFKAQKGNLLVSPYSLAAAVAMVNAGAAGKTREEVTKALGFQAGEDTSKAFQNLHEAFSAESKSGDVFKEADAVWPDKTFHLKSTYLDEVKRTFGVSIKTLDFAKTASAAMKINQWCSDNTQGKILELVTPADIQGARVVLTNAIYFYGLWAKPFEEKATRSEAFTKLDGSTKMVPMMWDLKERSYYSETDAAQVFALPYEGPFEMVVVLPREKKGLAALDLSKELDSLKGVRARDVQVALPKFHLKLRYDLTGKLPALGLEILLRTPNLSAMTGESELFVSKVIQETYVDVNEKGTEAAAATAMVMLKSAAKMPLLFRADHPFAFAIRHRPTGAIVFLGRLEDPEAASN